jgi:hypothetical protein
LTAHCEQLKVEPGVRCREDALGVKLTVCVDLECASFQMCHSGNSTGMYGTVTVLCVNV